MKKLASGFLLPVLVLLYGMNFMDRSVLSVVGDAIKTDLALSDAQLGMIHSVLLIMLIFLLIPAAAFCDIFGRRRMITIAAGIWSVAMALTGIAASFLQLVVARVFSSANESVVSAGGTSWLASYFPPEKRGRILGAFQTSSPLGMALGMFMGGAILAYTGNWRLCFYVFVLPGFLCMLLVPMLPGAQAPAGKGYIRDFPHLLRNKVVIFAGIGTGFYCIAKFAYQAWLPVLLQRCYDGLSPAISGAMCGAFLLAGAIGPFLGGSFSDWFNKRSRSGRIFAIMICFALLTISKILLYYLIGLVSLKVIFCLGMVDGVLTMLPLPIFFAIIQDVVDERFRAGVCGLGGAIVFLAGGAWGPMLVGIFSDYFGGGANGLRLAELALLVFPALSVLIYSLIIVPYGRQQAAWQERAPQV